MTESSAPMGAKEEKYPWTIETMRLVNQFDVDWFLLRQRFEQMEWELNGLKVELALMRAEASR